jgi:hypothetical protein
MKLKNQILLKTLLVGFLTLLVPTSALAAGQLTSRSATVTTSAAAATGVNYTVRFTLGTSGQTLGAIKFEICDSPVAGTACAGTAGSSGASFGSATFGSVTGLGGSWSANAGSAGGAGGTSIICEYRPTPILVHRRRPIRVRILVVWRFRLQTRSK